MTVVQHCEYIKTHRIIYFKSINCTIYELDLNKVIILKKEKENKETLPIQLSSSTGLYKYILCSIRVKILQLSPIRMLFVPLVNISFWLAT